VSKIGLYLCKCGPNIAEAIDLESIAQSIDQDKSIAKIETHNLLCSVDGKKFLAESIKNNEFERIVIAACSPKQHEATFMEVLSSTGLNPYMMQLVNIREQCAWVTPDKNAATAKALTAIRAAINRVKYHVILEKKEIECDPGVIIIGGGIAGLETALRTAQYDRKVFLIEENTLGGRLKKMRVLLPTMQSAKELLEKKIDAVRNSKYIEVIENCTIDEILGFFGSFVAHVHTQDKKEHELKAGAVVLALDGQQFTPTGPNSFGHGAIENVYTAAEFEASSSDKVMTKSGNPPDSVAIIHCAGRKQLGYCSKICCANSMKIARDIVNRSSNTKVIQFYKELCLPDKSYDRFYEEAKSKGIEFIRYDEIEIKQENDRLTVNVNSPDNKETKITVDMVILSTGMTPPSSAAEFARMFNVPLDEYGFLKQEHSILEPISTVTEGVFICGGMYGPGDIADSLAQAGAVAGKILSSLVPGKLLELEAKTSTVSKTMCMGCGACVDICAYGAVKLDQNKNISIVNEVLCRGCGNCASVCPSGAAGHRHFTTRQIAQEIIQILK
jgi:heterodisulfide reductase subunit A